MVKALEDVVRTENTPLVAAGEGNLTAPVNREQQAASVLPPIDRAWAVGTMP
jgi:hypothetical protein